MAKLHACKCENNPGVTPDRADSLMAGGMNELASLVVEAVRVLGAGMRSEDPAHAYRCASTVLQYASRLETMKEGRWALQETLSDMMR